MPSNEAGKADMGQITEDSVCLAERFKFFLVDKKILHDKFAGQQKED